MFNIKKIFILSSILSERICSNNNKNFTPYNNLLVFMEYTITNTLNNFVEKKPEELKDIFLFMFFCRDEITYQIMKTLLEYKYIILNKNEDEKKDYQEEIKKDLDRFLVTNINYEGYEEFVKIINNHNNEYLKYKICVLSNKDSLPDNYLSKEMDDLIKKYCIFSFITNEKKILKNCKFCKKKEINSYLQKMSISEKLLVYLKSYDRYVILERLDNEPFQQELNDENLKYLYIKYGFSLFYKFDKKLFPDEIEKFIHEIYCN
jgi:hypothetical protein